MSLRLAFGVVALTVLLLFYFEAYRTSRSGYSRWWFASMASFLASSGVFILEGTSQQFWATPVGCALMVLGVSCAWGAARSLRDAPIRRWQVAAGPVVTAIASAADDPGNDVWAGGVVYLFLSALMFGLSAVEMWRAGPSNTGARVPVLLASWLAFAFFSARWVVFVVDGPDGVAFTRYVGTPTTTIVSLIFLVVVSFSMSMVSNEMSTADLRLRATHDGLTGLLNRTEFLRLAADVGRGRRRAEESSALILADLDHFKQLNDTHGHQAGDRALQAFARACKDTVRSSDLVSRYGGEEFIVLLPRTDLDRAEQVTGEISRRFAETDVAVGVWMPTVSYGIVATEPGVPMSESISAADRALYLAKTRGRDQAVRGA